ncbi:MAG: glutathione S-transferase family protein [Sneathiella sp.]|nr:glutathione S-transferase family protein [Sneathiella sp.]
MHHLISHHLCPYVQRAVIVLLEKNIEHKRTYIDLANKPDWFQSLSPLGRVPLLQTQETVLFESQVIAEYLDEVTEGSLHPEDSLEKARHRSWIEFGSETLKLIGGLYNAPDKASFDIKRLALFNNLQRLEAEIDGPYFSGDQFHMIDGVWGTIFRYFDVIDTFASLEIVTDLEKLLNWREILAKRLSIQKAVPDGYAGRLELFLRNRESYLSTLMP